MPLSIWEVHDTTKLPFMIVAGMLICITTNVAANIAYLLVLPAFGPPNSVAESSVVAIDTALTASGGRDWAGRLVAFLVGLSVLGSLNGSVMCGGRYLFAAARDHELPAILSRTSQKYDTPYVSLLVQCTWSSIVLLMPWDLGDLIGFFGAASWIFYGMVAAALIRLRWTEPNLPRPYSIALYPVAPLTLICCSAYLVADSVFRTPGPCLAALAFCGLAVPVHIAADWAWPFKCRVGACSTAGPVGT